MSIADFLIAVLFGIVEGITEWLPISSTGHMILFNEFFKLNVSEAFFELYLVVIQLGAIMAVVVVFWKEIWPFGIKNNKKPWKTEGLGRWVMADKFSMWFKILVACIPAAIIGVLFDDILDKLFYNYICVAISLIVFGVAFIVVENYIKGKKFIVNNIDQISYPAALIIGAFQLIAAIFPGVSRSGSTIVGSLGIGIRREVAAKFTFFMAVPVMLGASLLKVLKYDGDVTKSEIAILAIGMIVAFLVSFVIIRWLMGYIRKHSFKVFGYYRIALGILVLLLGAIGVIGK
jgi:undecaprenyl-diphosphatase